MTLDNDGEVKVPLAGELDYLSGSADEDIKRCQEMYLTILNDADHYDEIRDYHNGHQAKPRIPVSVDPSIRDLADRGIMNMMRLAVDVPAQLSVVEGYSRMGSEDDDVVADPEEWDVWRSSNFRALQTTTFKTSLKYGAAYVALDGVSDETDDELRLRLLSTRRTVAYFDDPVNDMIPKYALTIRDFGNRANAGIAVLYDDEKVTYYDFQNGEFKNPKVFPHTLGECPVVRFPCELDDEGRATGIISPLMAAQDRINQTAFDLLVTQAFGSFKVRWAAGLTGDPYMDADGNPVLDENGFIKYKPMEVSQSRLWATPDANVRFGTMDETPLDGFIEALESAVKSFAVQSYVPPHSLLGSLANLSGETIEAAMGQTNRFTHMLRVFWSESIRQLMRLVRNAEGIDPGEDWDDEVRWRDTSEQTAAQVVDALGKASQMLGVPGEALWSRIPNVTDAELRKMRALKNDQENQDYDVSEDLEDAAEREVQQDTLPFFSTSEGGVMGGEDADREAGTATQASAS